VGGRNPGKTPPISWFG